MQKEMKDKWLEALRSGKYKQCTGALRRNSGFCCLGVLCDIIDSSKWIDEQNASTFFTWDHPELGTDDSVLPAAAEAAYEMNGHAVAKAIAMNDDGKSFAEIADYLEKEI